MHSHIYIYNLDVLHSLDVMFECTYESPERLTWSILTSLAKTAFLAKNSLLGCLSEVQGASPKWSRLFRINLLEPFSGKSSDNGLSLLNKLALGGSVS